MRDKHKYVPGESALLKTIYQQVKEKLTVNTGGFYLKLSIKFVFYFSITAFSYSLLYTVHNSFNFILCFILYGFVSLLFAFNFSHDFSHNTIFKSKRLNNVCFIAIYTVMGAHAEGWKHRHLNSHHYAPNVEGYDSDLKISKLIRVIPNSKYYWHHKYQHIYAPFAYATYSLFWVFFKDFVLLYSKQERPAKKSLKYHLSFWAQKVFYLSLILVLPILFSAQVWHVVLVGFLLMHLTQSVFLLFTFFMTHHVETTEYPTTDQKGNINASWLMNQIKSSNDMHPFSETANFILGGFNNHIAHHLFPNYHHIYYPELNKILYEVLLKNDIKPNQTSYWGGIVSHLRLLKLRSSRCKAVEKPKFTT